MREPRVDATLIDKLNESSVRKRYYPYDPQQIDWSVPLTDEWWYCPQEAIPFYGTPTFDRLDETERRYLSRCRSAALAQAGILIEQTLTRGFLQLLVAYDARWPVSRYMLHELAEESQHMLMFAEWLRRVDIRAPAPHWRLRVGSPLVALSATELTVPFFVVVLTGELTTDLLQAEASHLGHLHPTLRQMLRLHHVEEARHIAFAKDFLEKQFQDLSWGERQVARLMAPMVAESVAKTLMRVPHYEGMPAWIGREMLERASRSDARVELMRRAFRPLLTYFQDIDLITARELPIWRRLGLLD